MVEEPRYRDGSTRGGERRDPKTLALGFKEREAAIAVIMRGTRGKRLAGELELEGDLDCVPPLEV